jgi:L-lysine 6-transaminase
MCAPSGNAPLDGLRSIAREIGVISNVRGVGSLLAFTAPTPRIRDDILAHLFEQQVLVLGCGPDSIRFRLPLVMNDAELDTLLDRTARAVAATSGAISV